MTSLIDDLKNYRTWCSNAAPKAFLNQMSKEANTNSADVETGEVIKRNKKMGIIKSVRNSVFVPQEIVQGLVDSPGSDFLFLFDLIAHTCGTAATLRVLSFSAPSFYTFCQPILQVATKVPVTKAVL